MGVALGRGRFPGAWLASFGLSLRLEAADRTGLQGGDASWGVMGRGPQGHQESHQDRDPAGEQEEWGGRGERIREQPRRRPGMEGGDLFGRGRGRVAGCRIGSRGTGVGWGR